MAVFLQENGVLAMGNKTPVSILQEMLQKRGITPHYELIYNGVGELVPIFKYRVSGDGLAAIGEGKTKKAAKHDAAATYLKRLQGGRGRALVENADVQVAEEINVVSPYMGAIKENYVGRLDEVCVINKFPLPEFDPVKEEGPPHARIFTMKCSVSSISEIAVARTKKQAKHSVAQQMINRLMKIMGDKFIPPPENPPEVEDMQDLPAIEFSKYQEDMSVPLADIHNCFFQKIDDLPLPVSLVSLSHKPEEYYFKLEKPKEFLDNLLEEMGGVCRVTQMSRTELAHAVRHIDEISESFFFDDDPEEEMMLGSDDDLEDEINNPKYVLEHFDFGLAQDANPTLSNPAQTTPALTNSEETQQNGITYLDSSLEACRLDQESSEVKLNPVPTDVNIFLTVDCPQGQWVFRGYGENLEQATNFGSVEAIIFLRELSKPCLKKK